MNNPVAVQLFHLFMKRGFSVLRFNFRGVGRSQGEFDTGIGELADAATALDWLQSTNPDRLAVLGRRLRLRRLDRHAAADAPAGDRRLHLRLAADQHLRLLSFLAPCPASGLILHGSADTVVPPIEVERVVAKLRTQKGIVIDYDLVEGADHFWTENLLRGGKARRAPISTSASADRADLRLDDPAARHRPAERRWFRETRSAGP